MEQPKHGVHEWSRFASVSDNVGAGGAPFGRLTSEIEHGLRLAERSHYADAAAHLSAVREHVPESEARVLVALDGFIESHTRFWDAQQALHEASHRFVTASNDQEARFADLQEALTTSHNLIEISSSASPEIRHEPVSESLPVDAVAVTRPGVLPQLSISCFGRFEVRRGGERVEACRNKNGQAILRYLAIQPRHRETVDALVDALWPEDDAETARHKLHVAASALRGSLQQDLPRIKGGGYLIFRNGGYELDSSTVAVDVDEFESLFEAGQVANGTTAASAYQTACRLYGGALLPDDVYADWSFMRREQLAQRYAIMCSAQCAHELAAGHYAATVQWAAAMLDEDRCNESAYRQLMRAYAAEGRRGEALRLYHRCEQVLQAELGITPTAETTAVFYALLKGDTPPHEDARLNEANGA